MILKSLSVLSVASVLVAQSQSVVAVEALTKEDLTPFCQNQMIWGQFNITEEQCLAVSVPCSEEIAKKGMEMMQATQELYACVFKGLDIKMPMPPSE